MAIVLAADLLEKHLVVLIHDEDVNDTEARAEAQGIAPSDLGHGPVVGVDGSNHHLARLGSHRPRAGGADRAAASLVESAIDRKSTSGSVPPVSLMILRARCSR